MESVKAQIQNLDQNKTAGAAAVGGLVLATAAQLLMGRKVNLLATTAFTAIAGVAGFALKGGKLGGGNPKTVEELRGQMADADDLPARLALFNQILQANGGKFGEEDLALAAQYELNANQLITKEGERDQVLLDAFADAGLEHPFSHHGLAWVRELWQDATKHITEENAEAEVPKAMSLLVAHVKKPEHVAAFLASFVGLDLEEGGKEGAILGDLMAELKKGKHEKVLAYEHLKPFIENEEIGLEAMMAVLGVAEPTNIDDIIEAMPEDDD